MPPSFMIMINNYVAKNKLLNILLQAIVTELNKSYNKPKHTPLSKANREREDCKPYNRQNMKQIHLLCPNKHETFASLNDMLVYMIYQLIRTIKP